MPTLTALLLAADSVHGAGSILLAILGLGFLIMVHELGHAIRLMGRPWDEHTVKQGFAAKPQSTVALLVWIACYLTWRDLDPELVQVLQNGYDSMLCQWRIGAREEVVPEIKRRWTIPLYMPGGRVMTIPVEASVGLNWAKAGKDNPGGQKEIELG